MRHTHEGGARAERRKGISQVSVWRAFWRLIGAYLLLALATIAIYVGIVVATIGLVALGVTVRSPESHIGAAGNALIIGAVLLGCVAALAAIYAGVTLSFLVTPVVIAEDRISLGRGWKLARGNFWRIVLMSLSIWVPLAIAEWAYLSWLLGPDWLPFGLTQQEIASWSQHATERSQAIAQRMKQFWFVFYPLSAAITVLLFGLMNGLSAFAYRALSADESAA